MHGCVIVEAMHYAWLCVILKVMHYAWLCVIVEVIQYTYSMLPQSTSIKPISVKIEDHYSVSVCVADRLSQAPTGNDMSPVFLSTDIHVRSK